LIFSINAIDARSGGSPAAALIHESIFNFPVGRLATQNARGLQKILAIGDIV
jgi:hypothetical protein